MPNKINNNFTSSFQNPINANSEALPDDLKDVLGKVKCIWIDIKSRFNNSNEARQKANKEKIELYKYKKLSVPKKAFIDLTGHEVYSQEDVERLKSKDFKVYQAFNVIVSDKESTRLQAYLSEIAKENPSNYAAVVIAIKRLADSQNIPKEIKDLINKELEKIPLEKRKNLHYTKQRYEFSKPSSSISWKKIAIGSLIAIAIAGAAYGIYSYHNVKDEKSKKKPETKTPETEIFITPETKTPETEPHKTPKPKTQKICVFTSYSYPEGDKRLDISKMAVENHKKYCQKHGYSYEAIEDNLASPSLPYWSKIKGILNLSERKKEGENECDYVVWVDDDMAFTNSNTKIEDIISHHGGSDVHILVTKDSVSDIFESTPLNTGIIIAKNSDKTNKILTDVWNMRNNKVSKDFTYSNCPNQSCFHEQQAFSDYIKGDGKSMTKFVRIIPQRDSQHNINTFSRESHYDIKRKMPLDFSNDPEDSKWIKGDFLGHCTGLAIEGYKYVKDKLDKSKIVNLRKECLQRLIINK